MLRKRTKESGSESWQAARRMQSFQMGSHSKAIQATLTDIRACPSRAYETGCRQSSPVILRGNRRTRVAVERVQPLSDPADRASGESAEFQRSAPWQRE